MKKNIVQCFNKNALTYDESAFLQVKVGQHLAQLLPATAQNILEIGCGTGLFSEILIQKFPQAQLVLTDIAPNMINQCRQRLNHHKNIEFVCIDGENLHFDSKFDLIVSNMSLHWFTEHEQSFKKIINQLTSAGHFIFTLVGEETFPEWHALYDQYNYPRSTPIFPSRAKLIDLLPFKLLQSEKIIQSYKSAYDFVSSLKKIGATATAENKKPLSSGKLRKIFRTMTEELNITYEIISGHYINE